jgi:hypothetical protein
MSITRGFHIKIDPSETENAVRIWKTECASLMIQQKGCVSEKLLRCRDAPESPTRNGTRKPRSRPIATAMPTRRSCTRGLKGAKAEVKLHELVQ